MQGDGDQWASVAQAAERRAADAERRLTAYLELVWDLHGQHAMPVLKTSRYHEFMDRASELIKTDWDNCQEYVSKLSKAELRAYETERLLSGALESLDKAYEWVTTACAERDAALVNVMTEVDHCYQWEKRALAAESLVGVAKTRVETMKVLFQEYLECDCDGDQMDCPHAMELSKHWGEPVTLTTPEQHHSPQWERRALAAESRSAGLDRENTIARAFLQTTTDNLASLLEALLCGDQLNEREKASFGGMFSVCIEENRRFLGDTDAVVAMHAAFKRLEEQRDAAITRAMLLHTALERHGRHDDDCAEAVRAFDRANSYQPGPDIPVPCTCDLLAALAPPSDATGGGP